MRRYFTAAKIKISDAPMKKNNKRYQGLDIKPDGIVTLSFMCGKKKKHQACTKRKCPCSCHTIEFL